MSYNTTPHIPSHVQSVEGRRDEKNRIIDGTKSAVKKAKKEPGGTGFLSF
jgi:hypothetical protein